MLSKLPPDRRPRSSTSPPLICGAQNSSGEWSSSWPAPRRGKSRRRRWRSDCRDRGRRAGTRCSREDSESNRPRRPAVVALERVGPDSFTYVLRSQRTIRRLAAAMEWNPDGGADGGLHATAVRDGFHGQRQTQNAQEQEEQGWSGTMVGAKSDAVNPFAERPAAPKNHGFFPIRISGWLTRLPGRSLVAEPEGHSTPRQISAAWHPRPEYRSICGVVVWAMHTRTDTRIMPAHTHAQTHTHTHGTAVSGCACLRGESKFRGAGRWPAREKEEWRQVGGGGGGDGCAHGGRHWIIAVPRRKTQAR